MNTFVLIVVLALWLAVVSAVMPLSTLIAARPIGVSIVLAMFILFGLVLLFDHHGEEKLGPADDAVNIADEPLPANDASAGDDADEDLIFPLDDMPMLGGIDR